MSDTIRLIVENYQQLFKFDEWNFLTVTTVTTIILTIIFLIMLKNLFFNNQSDFFRTSEIYNNKAVNDEIVLRDFTLEQLRDYDGTSDKPIYISLKYEVYDVSSAREFYGEGSG
jgi:hypothetical protein